MLEAGDLLLSVRDLEKRFEGRRSALEYLTRQPRPRLTALEKVSFELRGNDSLGIVGESGSGKSTLARCIVRLLEPDDGSVLFRDAEVRNASREDLRAIRRRIQLIYQDPYASLNPRMRIGRAVAEPARVHGLVPRDGEAALVEELLERVGLPGTMASRYPRELSGGQRQRVAIARALAVQPELLIADEAVSALDVSIQAQVLKLFEELKRDAGLGMIFISHQLAVVAHLCDRIAIMYLGRIVEIGPTSEVFTRPRHPYTIGLLKAHPSVEILKHRRAPALQGELPSPFAIPSGCRFRTRCPYAEAICHDVDPTPTELGAGHTAWCHVLPSETVSDLHARTMPTRNT
jgi:oligopeptide transport system ATP-binding protein